MNVIDFINQHHHINYCEAIIFPNGDIEYATPSHIEALLKIINEPRVDIQKKMPMDASPINWLVDYTNCVALWYDFALLPEQYNSNQEKSIYELIKSNVLHKDFVGYMRKEISILNRNKQFAKSGIWYDVNAENISFKKL